MGGWNLKKSKWANPFKVGRNGTIDNVLNLYKDHVIESGLIKDIEELRGKVLGCWCKPGPCHGDILLELLGNSLVQNDNTNSDKVKDKPCPNNTNIMKNVERNRITFYRASGVFGFLSTMSRHGIVIDDIEHPTVEHYYQYCKSSSPKYREIIRNANTPTKARVLGNNMKFIVPGWESIKIEVMMDGLLAKFTQHEDLRMKLVDTYPAILINHDTDAYWGMGSNSEGQNELGSTLEALRTFLMDDLHKQDKVKNENIFNLNFSLNLGMSC